MKQVSKENVEQMVFAADPFSEKYVHLLAK